MRTNEGPVRSVVWAPAAFDDGGDSLAGRSVFMTAGHDGNVSIWDARRAVSFRRTVLSYPLKTQIPSQQHAQSAMNTCLIALEAATLTRMSGEGPSRHHAGSASPPFQ